AATIPQWVGSLDVVIVAGDDSADPRLTGSVDRALRRGAEVVVAAPAEGPMRAVAAGRAALLPPRIPVLDHNRLLRYLAVGLAVLRVIDSTHIGPLVPELDELAEVLDAEALRGGPNHEVFHNPAKTLAARMGERRVVLTGDSPAAAVVAQHGADVLLQAAGQIAAAADLTEAVAAHGRLVESAAVAAPGYDPMFHDEELDGPAPVDRARIFVISADPDQVAAHRRIAFLDSGSGVVDADLVNVDTDVVRAEVGGSDEARDTGAGTSRSSRGRGGQLEQLAVLALRLEMAAAYLCLLGGPSAGTRPAHNDGGHF
ncbi:MAG: tobH protein, partial [Nocardia sp.]|nr:tobH protein [Nocardia sp.]